jgi:pimeloyl-ACP methyl ester carboxylesterase
VARVALLGTEFNHRQTGDGEDVVFVHGLGANLAFWRFEVLVALGRALRLTVYDLKGHGYSSVPPAGYSTFDMASDLTALLDHLGIASAHLVGHSFGGLIALQQAALRPERVQSVTVIDSRVRALQPAIDLGSWRDADALGRLLEEVGLRLPEDDAEPGVTALDHLASPDVRQHLHRLSALRSFEGYVPFGGPQGGARSAERWRTLMTCTSAPRDFRDPAGLDEARLAGVRAPLLLLYGAASHCAPSGLRLQALLPWARLQLVPDAGHYFPVTRPQSLVEPLRRFLDDVRSGASAPGEAALVEAVR